MCYSITMDPLNFQEDEDLEEPDSDNSDPDTEESEENSDADTEESEEMILNATSVSAFDMILKSLLKTSVFLSDPLVNFVKEALHIPIEDESVLPQDMLRSFLLENLTLITTPLEPDGGLPLFGEILDLLPPCKSHFEFDICVVAEEVCNGCKRVIANSDERLCAIVVLANVLRKFKLPGFKNFKFENILEVIIIDVKIPCYKEGCRQENYVDRMINKLPSVFTIALEWENNETKEEIFETASLLATEIDISAIYRYEGDSLSTKHRLVSVVCSHGDLYNCVAYENNKWVRHYCSETEEIGQWVDVLNIFLQLHIRPEILFFEKVMQRDQMLPALGSEE